MSKYNIEKFKHVTVALNTPFAKDGSVDVEAVKAVSRYFRDKGVKQMYAEVRAKVFFWIQRNVNLWRKQW